MAVCEVCFRHCDLKEGQIGACGARICAGGSVRAVRSCHVELTTLIIPGENDSEEEMRQMCGWIAGLPGIVPGSQIPLHISRFFPRFHMTDREATRVKKIYRLAEVAREQLQYVYTGNC